MRAVLWTLPVAFGLWFVTFALPAGNFWFKLCLSACLLAVIGMVRSPRGRSSLFAVKTRHLWLGPASACLLYGIFWLGKEVSSFLLPFASGEISAIYFNKSQLDPSAIGLLLFFVMGPAEEIYWRGFVQRNFTRHLGSTPAVLLTATTYAFVHVFAFNLMLFVAAGVCGLFWGILYQREQSLIPVILSHSLWDVMVFVVFPLG